MLRLKKFKITLRQNLAIFKYLLHFLELRPRMCLIIDLRQMVKINMRIDLRCG